MQPIKELLNKIIWDRREDVSRYEAGVIDRFTNEITFIPLSKVRIEGMFMVIEGPEVVEIPLHRIRAVKKKGKVVWERRTTKPNP
jgi:uncharacterized protein (UPF0248 family)